MTFYKTPQSKSELLSRSWYKPAVKVLTQALRDESDTVRYQAAWSLGAIGPDSETAVPLLIEALDDPNEKVRQYAAYALGKIGRSAKESFPRLMEMLSDANAENHSYARDSLVRISEDLQDGMTEMTYSELEGAVSILEPFQSYSQIPEIPRAFTAIRAERNSRLWYHVKDFAQRGSDFVIANKWTWPLFGYAILGLLSSVLLFAWPRGLLIANEYIQRPEAQSHLTSALGYLFTVRLFYSHPRVLDAWMRKHRRTAQKSFSNLTTVTQHEIYVNLPIKLNEKICDIRGEELRRLFRCKNRTLLLIRGLGGAGKTSIACQLGKHALDEDGQARLTKHYMLPVLIEEEIGDGGFIEAIRGKLQALIGESSPISPQFLSYLLMRKRLLIILDHFSELTPITRDRINPEKADFPVAALVITSRSDERQIGNKSILGVTGRPLGFDRF